MNKLKNIIITGTAFMTSLLFVNTLNAQGIKFIEDKSFEDVLTMAKKADKPLFIDCYTSWCGPCKMLAKNIFTREDVGKYFNENFVCYKLQCDKNDINAKIAEKLNVTVYPTLLWLDGNGELLHMHVGNAQAPVILEAAATVFNESERVGTTIKKWRDGERTFDVAVTYFNFVKKSTNEFDDYFASLKESEKISIKMLELLRSMQIKTDSPVFDYVLTNRDKYAAINNDAKGYLLSSVIDDPVENMLIISYNTAQFDELCKKLQDINYSELPKQLKSVEWKHYIQIGQYEKFEGAIDKVLDNTIGREKDKLINSVIYEIIKQNGKYHNRARIDKWAQEYKDSFKQIDAYILLISLYQVIKDDNKTQELKKEFYDKYDNLSDSEKQQKSILLTIIKDN